MEPGPKWPSETPRGIEPRGVFSMPEAAVAAVRLDPRATNPLVH